MRRRSLILALLVVLFLLGGVSTTLALLVSHEPAYYRRGAIAAGKQRQAWSNQFLEEFAHLYNALQQDDSWRAEFTAEQINAYLQDGFISSGVDEKMLPDRVEAPRIGLDDDCLRLGFRYGFGRWNAIITIDLRVWVAKSEANTVGLELIGLHAGSLPISAQSLLEHVSEAARRSGVDVSWYRYDGHPVALLRFGADQPRNPVHLKGVEIKVGRLILQGRSTSVNPASTSTASN
jgi:hypothetical protein